MTNMAQQTEKPAAPAAVIKETIIDIHLLASKTSSASTKELGVKLESMKNQSMNRDLMAILGFSILTPKGDTWEENLPMYCNMTTFCLSLLFCYGTIKIGETTKFNPSLYKAYLNRFKVVTIMLVLTLLTYTELPSPFIIIDSPWVSEVKQLLCVPLCAVIIILSLYPYVDRKSLYPLATLLGGYFDIQVVVLVLKLFNRDKY